ncbi:hypothetical protein NGM37_28390, partial [Streptomyces sp. TRM76130]|nr:hypothetical protein [Streptomyces sp. TRM76130]
VRGSGTDGRVRGRGARRKAAFIPAGREGAHRGRRGERPAGAGAGECQPSRVRRVRREFRSYEW